MPSREAHINSGKILMNREKLTGAIQSLLNYVESNNYTGYDPYDTLNSWIPFKHLGKWPAAIATQIQKRNPVNIRPLLGIKKGINPKAFGLFLQGYSLLYSKTGDNGYREKADYIFSWLKENYTRDYSGHCWGYNFPWANPSHYYGSYTPSSVVTGFVSKGIFEYYKATSNKEAGEILLGASAFILNDILKHEDEKGICFSYTPLQSDLCFNSSLLAAEILAKAYVVNSDKKLKETAVKAVDWVLSYQKEDGRWNYSVDGRTGKENRQIDFHQGYVLESIFEIKNCLNLKNEKWEEALKKGARFYREEQFFDNGESLWRLPQRYPVEIHNQSQGIITFAKLKDYYPGSLKFSETVAQWTIDNMQAKDGHFYYRNYRFYKNKISFMRWSNAWMFLALSRLIASSN